MKLDILLSGFGGQGIMSLGKALAKVALSKGFYPTWFPSYGAEVRGGTAHCFVRISNVKISTPFFITPDVAVIFNQPSLERFEKTFNQNTSLILNEDFIKKTKEFDKYKTIYLPANQIALECGNIKVANTVILGLLSSLYGNVFTEENVFLLLEENFLKTSEIYQQNKAAFQRGFKLKIDKEGKL